MADEDVEYEMRAVDRAAIRQLLRPATPDDCRALSDAPTAPRLPACNARCGIIVSALPSIVAAPRRNNRRR